MGGIPIGGIAGFPKTRTALALVRRVLIMRPK